MTAGIAGVLWFAVLTTPAPEARCGTDPNILVAWGVSDLIVPGWEHDCRRTATINLAAGVGASAVPIIGGAVLIVLGIGRRRTRLARERSEAIASAEYGKRSQDGSHWWDGYRWQRITDDTAAPAEPPG
jgi:hypothetical protein